MLLNKGPQPFFEHVRLQHFDRRARTPKISHDNILSWLIVDILKNKQTIFENVIN